MTGEDEVARERCPVCDDDRARVELSRGQWVRQVREVDAAIAEGSYVLEHADVPLAAVTHDTPVPGGDTVRFVVRCTGCGWPVELGADSYHGNAAWTPADPRLRDAPDAPDVPAGEVERVEQRNSVRAPRTLLERFRDALAAGRAGRPGGRAGRLSGGRRPARRS